MEIGLVTLCSVYEAIRASYPTLPSAPPLPERTRSVEFGLYRAAFSHLVSSIPDKPGIYLWFSQKLSCPTEFIYVGETRRQGLQKRLKKEFTNWHHCFWATCFHTDKYLAEAIEIYVVSNRYHPKRSKYTNSICSDWLKRGATHIAYATGFPSKVNLKALQDDLIQLFGNPRGNIADLRAFPLDRSKMLPIATKTHEKFLLVAQSTDIYHF